MCCSRDGMTHFYVLWALVFSVSLGYKSMNFALGVFVKYILIAVISLLVSCTQESQNRLSRGIQNWTGTNGVLDVISGGKTVYRFINIDKMTTAKATQGANSRPYRYGYGVFDKNLNFKQDLGEKKVYFEISDYSTHYIFYENPH